jgi:hypothetical protein
VTTAQPLSAWSLSEERFFQNQLVTLGGDATTLILHAKQMGYDYINGQPWSAIRSREGTASGLGVLFNTGADSAKWMRINSALTKINGRPITGQDRANFDKAFCMKNPNATVLTDRFKRDPQYSGETVLFHPNYFSSEAIDILVAYNIELFESFGGTATHAGVYIDQVNAGPVSPHPGPCLNPGPKNFATAADGQLEYIKRLRNYFRGQLGLPIGGNPYRIKQYSARHSKVPLDLYYNEMGDDLTNHVNDFGAIPSNLVAVTLAVASSNDYLQALRTAGIAMKQGSWFGWFNKAHPSTTDNGVQLLRVLPNWDNLVNASNRSWNSNTLVYRTSNSYADPNVAYGRHPKTGKLFVVFQNLQGAVQLRPGEVVKDVKQVDELFIETTDGQNDLTINGSLVSLANTQHIGEGYIITTTMKPNSIPIADAGTNKTVITGAVVQLNGSGSEDADGDPLTYSWKMVTVPPGSQMTLSAPQTAQPSFVPDKVGQYVVSLQVNDGKATSAPAVVTITTIHPTNSPPLAHSQTLSTSTMKAVKTVLNGSDPDGDPLTFYITVPPVNGKLSGLPPHMTYSPKSGFSGDDLIVFRTHDGKAESDPATVSIRVTPLHPTLQNLILNPSFEETPVFDSWAKPKPGTHVSSTLSTGSAPHGAVSAQVNIITAGQAADVVLRQTISLSPGGVYRLRFWAKASSNRKLTTLLIQDKSPWNIVGLWKQASLSSQWQQFETVFTYTGVEPNARLVFRMGDRIGKVWIDNVELIAQR